MYTPQTIDKPASAGPAWKRLLPLAVLAAGIAAFFAFDIDMYATFDTLRDHRSELMAAVDRHPVLSIVIFTGIYALATAFSLPGGALLTLTAGFLFGIWIGTTTVVLSATVGASALFLAARSAVGNALRARAGPFIRKMEAGFAENALSYLLVLRLVPIFPFFIVNLVPAVLGVPFRTYVIGTFFGIIPGTFVFASVGAGLGSIFDGMQDFAIRDALTPEVVTALIGLAVLSLIPVAYKALKARRGRSA